MAENWQETAQLYEQLFQKPKMSEKLLSKPPFRYLHDIFTATMSKTGWGNGLFQGDELNSKSFEDKDSKLGFLVKLITLTEMMVGEKIDIKPSMVLAGQQADKTNVWLQQMFRAATAGVDSTPYIQQILGGGEEDGAAEEEGQADGQEDDGGAAEAEAQARAQAEAEQQAKMKHDQEKAERKKRAEEKKRRQKQAEEEEQQRLAYEQQEQERMMQQQQQMEQEQMMQQQQQQQMMQQQQQQEMQQRSNVIRDDDDGQDDEDDGRGGRHMDEMEPTGFEGRGGALVEEARKLMQDDDQDSAPKEQEASGPKIKMNKIGRRGKKGSAAAPNAEGKKDGGAAGIQNEAAWKSIGDKASSGGGFTEQDIEFMKKAIQVLCQSTNPLGKSIDFVTDDIDSMNKEFEHWRKESQSCQVQLLEQQKITEEVVKPLQDELAEIEEKIREQTSKVNSVKSSIMRNDITVQNLLYSVITTR